MFDNGRKDEVMIAGRDRSRALRRSPFSQQQIPVSLRHVTTNLDMAGVDPQF
jgi:hypothetical protein